MTSGLVLAQKYRLTSVLGRGGMGTVWRGEHLELAAPVAIKILDASLSSDETAMRQCRHEARAAAALRSPHVVQVLDFGRDDATGTSFIVMELLEGESLADRLARAGRLAPGDTARVVSHVARALWRAHEAGIVHRDLKPANVFLVRNDDEETAKVLDFGTARIQSTGTLTTSGPPTGAVVGTPYYMSPEHISGGAIDHRTDLWALGIIACECLLGRRPFDAIEIGRLVLQICTFPLPTPSRLASVPAGFDGWFARATQRDPDRRFQSARDLADELRRACDGDGGDGAVLAPAVPPPPATAVEQAPTIVAGTDTAELAWTGAAAPRTPPLARRRRLVPAGLVVAAVAVVGVMAFGLRPRPRMSGGVTASPRGAPLADPAPTPTPIWAPSTAQVAGPATAARPGPPPAASAAAAAASPRPPATAGLHQSAAHDRKTTGRRANAPPHPLAVRHRGPAPQPRHVRPEEPSPSVEAVLDQRR